MRIISNPLQLCPSHIRSGYIKIRYFNGKHSNAAPALTKEAGEPHEEESKAEQTFKIFMRLINQGNSPTPYDKAIRYLNAVGSTCNFQTLASKSRMDTSNLISVPSELFTPGIVYDLVADLPGIDSKVTESLLDFIESQMNSEGLFNFFEKKCFNDDVDDTSVCLWALLHSKRLDSNSKLGRCVAKAISMNTTTDTLFPDSGKSRQVIQTFFPPFKGLIIVGKSFGKLDPVVMSNCLRLLYFFQMADLANDTQDCVHDWLVDDTKFKSGLRYYNSPDSLLYFLSNCLQLSEQAHSKFHQILIKRLEERLGNLASDSTLDRAQRILTAYNLGVIDSSSVAFSSKTWTQNKVKELGEEREKLCESQRSDGSWPLEPFYKQASGSIKFYNTTGLTAFAAKALHVSSNLVS